MSQQVPTRGLSSKVARGGVEPPLCLLVGQLRCLYSLPGCVSELDRRRVTTGPLALSLRVGDFRRAVAFPFVRFCSTYRQKPRIPKLAALGSTGRAFLLI